jgi:hypothetical protein
MRTINRIAATAATAAVLFGMTGLASAAAAEPVPAVGSVSVASSDTVADREGTDETVEASAITKRFTITNESSRPLTITGYQARERMWGEMDLPAVGTVVQPGQQVSFDVVFHFFYVNDLIVHFSAPGLSDAYNARLTVSDGIAAQSSTATSSGSFAHGEGGASLWVKDAVGTVIEVPASDSQKQSQILGTWCKANSGSCSFSPKSQTPFTADLKKAASYANPTTVDQSFTAEFTHTRTEKDTLEVSASVKATVMSVVEAGVTATYGKAWEQTDTRTLTYPVIVPAGTKVTVLTGAQMLRTTGDFTVTMGNTTWKLRDVSFDTPEMTNFGPDIELVTESLTAAEVASLPHQLVIDDGADGAYRAATVQDGIALAE